MSLAQRIRSVFTPAALRVSPHPWPPGLPEAVHELANELRWETIRGQQPAQPAEEPHVDDLIDLAVSLWRLQKRLQGGPGRAEPVEGRERDYHHLRAAMEALERAGVEARDHDGMLYSDYGSDFLDPIAFQPTPGLDRQRVIQTVAPTIFVRGEWARMGKVIVGVPESDEPATNERDEP